MHNLIIHNAIRFVRFSFERKPQSAAKSNQSSKPYEVHVNIQTVFDIVYTETLMKLDQYRPIFCTMQFFKIFFSYFSALTL